MNKILFISPSWSEKLGTFGGIARFTSTAPPMGICYLAAVAAEAGWEAALIDNETERLTDAELRSRIKKFNPSIVAISSMTPNIKSAMAIAEFVRESMPGTPVLLGGPHISSVREKGLEACFDIGVLGEGELTLATLLSRWNGESIDCAGVPGILYRDNEKVVATESPGWIQDLDSLPFPRRDLLLVERYTLYLRSAGHVAATSVVSSRGCPFKCAYCSEPVSMGTKTRHRGTESILSEMENCNKELGISHFCFLNSTLTLDRNRMIDLSDGIIKRKLPVSWSGWTRADYVDRELIKKMKEAGFARITLALESADETILRNVGRKMSLDKVREGFRICAEEKLEVWCLAMIGLPGETEQTVKDTVEFIRALPGVLTSSLSIAIPYPGTRLYDMAKNGEQGLKLLTDDFSKYQRYDGGVMNVGTLTPERLMELQKKGLMRIHLTPQRILYFFKTMGFKGMLMTALLLIASYLFPSKKTK